MSDHYLTVGINKYPRSPLSGCVNDALDWARELTLLGYRGSTLLDEQATGDVIRERLKAYVGVLRRGDRFVFAYSGHGTNVPDTGGDEADGRDEALCPVDVFTNGVITDDELQTIFAARRFGVRIVVVSDSCHSGTVTDGIERRALGRIDLLPAIGTPAGKAKMLPPEQLPLVAQGGRQRRIKRAILPPVLLLAGAQDSEYSYDATFGGRPCGAFSFAALNALHVLGPQATWAQVIGTAKRSLPSTDYPQTPNLVATRSQRRWRVGG